jgi:hypothetical protein
VTLIVRIGDKLVEVEEKDGVPVIKDVASKEIVHPDGRVDVEIHIPCLVIQAKKT